MRSNFLSKKKTYICRLLTVILIVMTAWYISENYYQLMMISGDSMLPNYHNLQIVILDKHSDIYDYGDVIAFQCDGLDSVLVKRIIACPGDTVVIAEGTLYVNGKISEIFSQENIFDNAGIAKSEIFLEENSYFVVGDNIAESKDSRYLEVGSINKTDIIGKVLCQNKK